MDEAELWALIDAARSHAPGVDGCAAWLVGALTQRGGREAQRFGQAFDHAMGRAYRWDLWGVATLVHDGHEDEERFADFRAWLISLGRDAFEAILADPDAVAPHLDGTVPNGRALSRVARVAFAQATGTELPLATMDLFANPRGEPIPASQLTTRFPRVAAALAR
ncbi:MAG: DUF4240 domain-containing protein [Myxococcales bacterium]|nr:DUF4240 domain-containing protein [Myxococcales bacterium]